MTSSDDETRLASGETFRSVSLSVLLVASVVLAGCSSVPFLGGGGQSVSAPDDIKSKLEVSPATIYQRVEELTGIEGEYPAIEMTYITPTDVENRSLSFLRVLAGAPPSRTTTRPVPEWGYNPADQVVFVNRSYFDRVSQAQLQTVIAGAYFQALMFQQNWSKLNPNSQLPAGKIGELAAVDSLLPGTLIGGSINYVQRAYANEHLPNANVKVAPKWSDDASIYEKWLPGHPRSPVGLRYFQATLDSPAGLSDFFSGDLPVRTTEQLIHRSDDQPLELGMELSTDNWWQARDPNPYGELGTRIALTDQLSSSKAKAAAAGWGNDAIAVLQSHYGNETRGVVWAHRWDSPSEADEFASAMETFIEGRESETDDVTFELRRPADDMTILVGGSNNFRDLVRVSVDGTTVSVAIGNP